MTEVPPPARSSARYTRELTALVLAPVAVWMIGWSHEYVFDGAVALIAVMALHEFITLGKRMGYDIPIVLCAVVTLFIIAAFILESVSVEMGMFVTLLIIPASYVFRSGDIEHALPSSAIAVLATMYVGMLAGSATPAPTTPASSSAVTRCRRASARRRRSRAEWAA
jgi:CDP-diglyceride synthetase